MKTVTVELYKFEELSDKAKETAIQEMYDINVNYDWWDTTYEDAKTVGLKITGFDIGRGSDCDIEFIDTAEETARLIQENHGESCETYKTAAQYLIDRAAAIEANPAIPIEDEDDDTYDQDQAVEDVNAEFLKALAEDYLTMLRDEYEYLTSDEAIIETIEANDYDFSIKGKRGVTVYNAD